MMETGLHLPLATFSPAEGPRLNVQCYPKASCTNEEILADRELFDRELQKLSQTMRFARAGLKVAGKEVDLHRLYTEVVTRGGLESVIKNQLWVEVCTPFNFPDTFTDKSFKIRNLYSQNLHHFEQVFFWRNDGPIIHPPKRKERAPNTHGAFGRLSKSLAPKYKFKPQLTHRFPPPRGLDPFPRFLPHVSFEQQMVSLPQLALDHPCLQPMPGPLSMPEQHLNLPIAPNPALPPEPRTLHPAAALPLTDPRTMQVLPAADQDLPPTAAPLVLERITQPKQVARPEPRPASAVHTLPVALSELPAKPAPATQPEPRPTQPPTRNQEPAVLKLDAPSSTAAPAAEQPRGRPATAQDPAALPPRARPPQGATQAPAASQRPRAASQPAAAGAADAEHRHRPVDVSLNLAAPQVPAPTAVLPGAVVPHAVAGPHGFPPHSHPYSPDADDAEWDEMECMPGGPPHMPSLRPHHYYYASHPVPYMPHPVYGDMHMYMAPPHMMGPPHMMHPDMCPPPMEYQEYADYPPYPMPMPMYGMMHMGGMSHPRFSGRHMYMPYPPGAARSMPPGMRRVPSPKPGSNRASPPAAGSHLPPDALPPEAWPAMYRHGEDEDEDMEEGDEGEAEEEQVRPGEAAELDAPRDSKDPSAGGSTCTHVRADGRPAPTTDQWNSSKRPMQQGSTSSGAGTAQQPSRTADVDNQRDVYAHRPPATGPRPAGLPKVYPPGMRPFMAPCYPGVPPMATWVPGWRPGWDDTAE